MVHKRNHYCGIAQLQHSAKLPQHHDGIVTWPAATHNQSSIFIGELNVAYSESLFQKPNIRRAQEDAPPPPPPKYGRSACLSGRQRKPRQPGGRKVVCTNDQGRKQAPVRQLCTGQFCADGTYPHGTHKYDRYTTEHS